MIGKPEWFERRKYGGWGFHPKTWQGWVYTALIILPFAIFQSLPFWYMKIRFYITGAWLIFLLIDVTHIMVALKRDEREQKIEAISERNAAWFMMLVLALGLLYDIIQSVLNQTIILNWFLIIALLGGAMVKTISNVILERRSL